MGSLQKKGPQTLDSGSGLVIMLTGALPRVANLINDEED